MKKYNLYIFLSTIILVLMIWNYFFVKPEVQNLNNGKIGILGHRGMSTNYIYPGNSAPSIQAALMTGADGTELDIQMSQDGLLIVYHHKYLDDYTTSNGAVYQNTSNDLINSKYSDSKNIYVMTLDSLFRFIDHPEKYWFSFDCKLYGIETSDSLEYYNRYVSAIDQTIKDHGMEWRIFIESNDLEFHRILRSKDIQAYQFITGHGVKKGIKIASELGLYGIGAGSSVSAGDIRKAHDQGLRVMTWTPRNSFDNIRAVRKNPDYIQTADLPHLIRFLRND